MTNTEINELIFVTLGYAIFAWLYYKIVKKMAKREKDKCIMVAKVYVGTMFALPLGMLAITILKWLYSIIFGGG